VPWGVLDALRQRPLVVAPSVTTWWQRATPGPPPVRVAMVSGPDLPGGDEEVQELGSRYPSATVLRGVAATAANVLEALASSDLVHIAAHGTFRADSPLFSALRLADGPLTVYDLERLERVAPTILLPACHAATAAVRAGDELIGTAAALLGLGVRSLVAPVGAVPDDATRSVMVIAHDALRRGAGPAQALAAARAAHAGDELGTVTAGMFVCLGAG
jgi:CHAT domain-containing protein